MTPRRTLECLLGVGVVWAMLAGMHIRVAATEGVGDLFSVGVSARALGLGGAFTAIADDEAGVLYNPARLSSYRGIGLSSLYVSGFGGVGQGAVVVAVPYAAFGVLFLDSGLIDEGEGGFRYACRGAVLGVGVPVGAVSLGIRWRFLRVSTPFEGTGWSLDPAISVDVDFLDIGLVWEGAASAPISYAGGRNEEWARGLRLGVAAELSPTQNVVSILSFDAIGLFGESPCVATGVEAWVGGVGARVGYDGTGLACGLSVRFVGLEVDWAYTTRADLGSSHMIGLVFRF
ncbi:MAG: hypothetical protein NTY63_05625 [Candidatus Bipolaricaulota bacterium]|nr:hypothetical protein [Candidatus Bipolaricaulota bacterium]